MDFFLGRAPPPTNRQNLPGSRHVSGRRVPPLGEGLTRVVVESVLICGCPLGDLWMVVVVRLRLRLGGRDQRSRLYGGHCAPPRARPTVAALWRALRAAAAGAICG